MGSASSKSPVTPAASHVPASVLDVNSDPRSPTPDVARTPLKGNTVQLKHNITKNTDLRKVLESSNPEAQFVHNNPIFSAVLRKHLHSYDPRSPAQDFQRTPIVLPADKQLLRLQTDPNESLTFPEPDSDPPNVFEGESLQNIADHLREDFHSLSMDSSLQETGPLGSSTASQEAIESNVSAVVPTGLLETNFDYVAATDTDKLDTPDQSVMKAALKQRFEIIEADPRSPSLGIERTPIVVAKTEDVSEESVEEMSEECLVRALQSCNAGLRSVRAGDQQALLIYEDDSKVPPATPKTKSASNSGSRTPLSCMRNKTEDHVRSSSANALVEAKKKTVSKIPKRVQPRMLHVTATRSDVCVKEAGTRGGAGGCGGLGDYENTPPHSHRDAWDKDTSVVL